MRYKTRNRIVGAKDAAMCGCFGYLDYVALAGLDYGNLADFYMGEYPLEVKIFNGLLLGVRVAFVPISIAGISGGLLDIIRGTDQYLGLRVWKKLTRSRERKMEIGMALDEMLERREKQIPNG